MAAALLGLVWAVWVVLACVVAAGLADALMGAANDNQ